MRYEVRLGLVRLLTWDSEYQGSIMAPIDRFMEDLDKYIASQVRKELEEAKHE